MSRFVAVVDGSGRWDLAARLAAAQRAMTAGGSRETCHVLLRPPFGLLLLTRRPGEPPWREDDTGVAFAGGFGPEPSEVHAFVRACAASAAGAGALPTLPGVPLGRRAHGRWHPVDRSLTIVTELNGQRPVYHWHSEQAVVVAVEPKGIWAVLEGALELDADGLVQLWTLGHCLGSSTLFRGVRCAEPGAVLRFSGGTVESRALPEPRFSEAGRGDAERLAARVNRSMVEVLEAHRPLVSRVTVALSGGMDSRYVLAAALGVWRDVATFTFGEPGSADAELGAQLARCAGVANRRDVTAPDFLARWAPYAVWRSDGMLNCMHSHGIDATIALGAGSPAVLNGIGGDFLMGAFLRPSHLLAAADPDRAVRFVRSSRRFHDRPLTSILKPRVLERAGIPVEDSLRSLMARYRYRRLGNLLVTYWLRHYSPRITAVGMALEEPWVDYIGPMIDPAFVRAAADIPLELRFMSRAYRRALGRIAPELAGVRWERTGLSPRWPWPAHALGRYGRRLGLLPRSRPAVDHARHFREELAPFLRDHLLSPRTLAEGFLQPDYLRDMVEEHLSGRGERTAELSLALTVELWRRMFIERDGVPTGLPIEVPEAPAH